MLVFFSKQKTAYEMRISDWSSDVCSSDLDMAPVGVQLEAVLVHLSRHVGRDARIGVVPPRATDVGGPLEEHEVLDPRLPQLDGHTDPTEAGTDDHHLVHRLLVASLALRSAHVDSTPRSRSRSRSRCVAVARRTDRKSVV